MIDAVLGQFQCLSVSKKVRFSKNAPFQVEQRLDKETGKLHQQVLLNGNRIESWNIPPEEVFTGPLQVWISDKWHPQGGRLSVLNFIYETLK